jgi:hypothetical protein
MKSTAYQSFMAEFVRVKYLISHGYMVRGTNVSIEASRAKELVDEGVVEIIQDIDPPTNKSFVGKTNLIKKV